MSLSIQKEQAALAKEEGKLKKFLKSVQKFFAKEFLLIVLILLIALPVALFLDLAYDAFASEALKDKIDQLIGDVPLYIWWYIIATIGCYFSRMVIGAIQSLTKPAASS